MDFLQLRLGVMATDANKHTEDLESPPVQSLVPKGLEVRVVTPFTPSSPFSQAPVLGFTPNPHAQRPFSEPHGDTLGRAVSAYQHKTTIVQRTELRVKYCLRALLILLVACILWTLQRARRFGR